MSLHKNATGNDLHYPQGRSPTPLQLDVDTASAYLMEDSANNRYLDITTTTGVEVCTLGNTTTNPDFTLTGTGKFTSGGGHRYATSALVGAGSTHDMVNESHVILVDTSAGTETLNLSTASQVPNQLFLIIDQEASFGTNNFTLHPKPGAKLDNSASDKILNDNNTRLWLFCDGTDWYSFLDGESQAGGGGTGGFTMDAKDVDFTAVADFYYVVDTLTNAAAITVTLPNAGTTASAAQIGFKARHGASFSVTLDRSAGGNIDGAASNFVLTKNMAGLVLICDGTDWWIKS